MPSLPSALAFLVELNVARLDACSSLLLLSTFAEKLTS